MADGEQLGWRPGQASADPVPPVVSQPADVTVVIPVKDRAGLVGDAIRSAQSQQPPPTEIIVVDDGSSDGSGAVAAALGVTVLRNEVPQRQGPARNQGMARARTTWVAFLDDDDLWLPGHLAGLLRAAEGGDAVLVTAPGRTTAGGWRGNTTGSSIRLDPAALLVPGEGLVMSATMVRREQAMAVGGFPPLALCEDFAFWLTLLDRGPGLETSRPTVLYRLHPGQMSLDAEEMRDALDAVVSSLADRPWFSPGLQRRWRSRLVWDTLRAAQSRGDWPATARGLAWYAVHPDAVPALVALLRARRRMRIAAARHPVPQVVLSGRSGDPGTHPGGDLHPPA